MNGRNIGNKLRELRGTKSQEQVAEDLDISFSSYAKYEQGIRVPRDEVKIRIAQYYKKTVQSIFFTD